jgi:hypothetical protein
MVFTSSSSFVSNSQHTSVGRDSSVSIATPYGLDGPGIEPRWGQDFPQPSRPALGPTQSHIVGYQVLPGGKVVTALRWPPTPCCVEVKERVKLYIYCASMPSWPVLWWTFFTFTSLLYFAKLYFFPKIRRCETWHRVVLYTDMNLHGVTSHKTITVIPTASRSSDFTDCPGGCVAVLCGGVLTGLESCYWWERVNNRQKLQHVHSSHPSGDFLLAGGLLLLHI